MPKRIKVPYYAKLVARQGLIERERNNAGLTKSQASKLGIVSGVERARQIIRNKYIKEKDLRSMARFYLRFRNQRTPRTETAIRLWGGRRFLSLLVKIYYPK